MCGLATETYPALSHLRYDNDTSYHTTHRQLWYGNSREVCDSPSDSCKVPAVAGLSYGSGAHENSGYVR